jgi:hypothetical protein
VLDQVEERVGSPLDVVKEDDERRLLAESFRNAQAISSTDVACSLSPSSERIAAAAAGSLGRAPSCLITSTTGQYVISSP